MTKFEIAKQIVENNKGKKLAVKIAALENAGIKIMYAGILWNFGQVGTVKDDLIQLECAIACKSRKNGFIANKCNVYQII
jgi:hypothetical protein